MADKKTQLMAQFYQQCQQKGYTDMSDSTQSLKAKVIATDLKLNYGNIAAFYERAKESYELIQIENAGKERQRKKEEKEVARRAVDGILLVTVSDSRNSRSGNEVKVFLRPDESIYCTVNNGAKIEGAPSITLHQGGVLSTTYHPSQAVYTGATVGGITTGGVHYTKESYSQKATHSGKGYIQIKAADREFTVAVITPSEYTKERFRRDKAYKKLIDYGEIRCYQDSVAANMYANYAMTGAKDYASMMDAASFAAEERRLPMSECMEIQELLGRMVNAEFPPTDEEAYASALSLSKAKTAAELKQALDLFRSISDFRDAEARADAVEAVYESVLQAEKEAAVLAKEAKRKRNIVIAILLTLILIICIIAGKFISREIKERQEEAARQAAYQSALALLESGSYDSAIEAFSELGDYLDSKAQISAAEDAKAAWMQENLYKNALNNAENGHYMLALEQFQELGNYQDSQDWIKKLEVPAFKESVAEKEVFQTVTFGTYEQDGNTSNGPEPIEWVVFQEEGNNDYVVLMSLYILDAQPFHTERDYTTWAYSSIREWLNDDFAETAFTKEEIETYLLKAQFTNPSNPFDGTDCGPDTEDGVFLLNAQEASYFHERHGTLITNATPYAQSKGLKQNASWMLRSVNEVEAQECNAVCVCRYDSMDNAGKNWEYGDTAWGVRPCILFYTGIEIE